MNFFECHKIYKNKQLQNLMKDKKATLIIDIKDKTKEELFSSIDRSRRKNILKSIREGLKFEDTFSSQDIEEAYLVYTKVWFEGGINPMTKDEWDEKLSSKEYKLFILKLDSKIIGSAIIRLITKKYYGEESDSRGIRFRAFSSKKEFNDFRPNDFLYWNSILYALKNKMDFVDLGGYQINPRGHLKGINRFKQMWGGKLFYFDVDFPFYQAIGRKLMKKFNFFWWMNEKLKGRDKVNEKKVKKILVIRNDHIGDLILSTAAFREIKKSFPNANLTALVSKINKEIIENNNNVDRIIISKYNPKNFIDFFKYLIAIKKIRKEKFDMGFDLRGDFLNTLSFLKLGNVKKKIGFYKNTKTQKLLDYGIPKNASKHETLLCQELISQSLKINSENFWPEITITNEDEKEAENFIKKNNLEKFICIAPETPHPGKQWPLEKFDEVIKWLQKNKPEYRIVLVGTDNEKLEWLKNKNKNILKLEKTNLRMLYILFQKSSLLLTLDIGTMHIGWAGNSKLIGLILKFSAPSIKNIEPLGENSHYLIENEIEIDATKEIGKGLKVKDVIKEIDKVLI
jgi:heptosyltransferase II